VAAHASLFALVDRVVRSEKTPLLEGSVVMSLTHKVHPQPLFDLLLVTTLKPRVN
jgi:hypothetical protein